MDKLEKESVEETINLFLDNFKEKDLYTQIMLEIIFENLKYEKK